MKIGRAIGIGIVLFVVSLIINAISSKIIGVDLNKDYPASFPLSLWLASIISVVILSILGSLWYFKSPKIVPDAKNGFLQGLVIIILGFILDGVAIVPRSNGRKIMTGYYKEPLYWTALIVILVICTFMGYLIGLLRDDKRI